VGNTARKVVGAGFVVLTLTFGACGGGGGSQDGGDARDAADTADAPRDTGATPDVAAMPDTAPDLSPEPADARDGSAPVDAVVDAVDAGGQVADSGDATPPGDAMPPGDAGGVPIATACGTGNTVFTGDFDGDTRTDCVVWTLATKTLAFHKGLAAGAVDPVAIASPGAGGASLNCAANMSKRGVADLNGDNRDDLVFMGPGADSLTSPYDATVMLGQADGRFVCAPFGLTLPLRTYAWNGPAYAPAGPAPVVADVTGDGVDDLVSAGSTVASTPNTNILEWSVIVGSRTAPPLSVKNTAADVFFGATGGITSFTVSDVNVDGKLDVTTGIFVRYLNGTTPGNMTIIWYGKGDGTFQKTPPP
jgi:hypothetical protein